ncbi:hypothetical protein PG987_011206 [Apiospora arundinis]
MFLPTFLNPSGSRSSSHKSKSSRASPEPTPVRSRSPDPSLADYLYDESQLEPPPPLPKELLDLNTCLEILATIFPDVQVEVFREMLASFSEESRLEVIADAMLKNPAVWVKGRRRLRGGQKEGEAAIDEPPVPPTEAFRGSDYRNAVRTLAWHEFKGLSKSAIDAVLSESNYSYLDARPTLVNLSSKSWKFTISSMLFRRKPVTTGEAENHPLVVWKSSGQGYIVPTIKATGNAVLDKELFTELIVPLKRREATTREESDRTLAMALHTEEAEAAEATYECACCFTEATFEEFTTCNTPEGHMICFRCVQHSITEAIFGQGWHRSINKDTGTLHCPAVASQECKGCISADHIHRAMMQEKNGAEVLRKLDQRLADHDLLSSNLPLIRCPFCNYAEVDDLYLPQSARKRLRLRASNLPNLIFVIVVTLCVFPVSIPLIAFLTVAVFFLSGIGVARNYAISHFRAAITRHQRRRHGLRFVCRNLACGQASCMSCSKGWVDIHVCHESELVALRTAVEQAMSLAVKRVCPRCYTSFVKSAGCNKLTCPCGYKMCYVCRADIGASNQGYSHFCQHFRPEGDGRKCLECRKCNLWEAEDQEAILRQAREDTERKWRDENRDLSAAERAYLDTGVAASGGGAGRAMQKVLTTGRLPSINDVFDFFVETLLVV